MNNREALDNWHRRANKLSIILDDEKLSDERRDKAARLLGAMAIRISALYTKMWEARSRPVPEFPKGGVVSENLITYGLTTYGPSEAISKRFIDD